ncbi:hypothetical protein ALC60_05414 [Trachymyrmex zeteki]|uniref:Uncharacterized protein n=1 Tax=Mycetomoellerius zeteki TaxID=64791 RepID=A0A151X5I8_9HYME|nr:hypothetical protein ALC60_05414 [Trachymyrmex zeteki]
MLTPTSYPVQTESSYYKDLFAKYFVCHKCNTSSSHIGPWPGPKKPFFLAIAIPPYPKDLQMTTAVAFVKSSSHTVPHTP